MLAINSDWVVLFVVLATLVGFVLYQRRCWLCDDEEAEERRSER